MKTSIKNKPQCWEMSETYKCLGTEQLPGGSMHECPGRDPKSAASFGESWGNLKMKWNLHDLGDISHLSSLGVVQV